MTPLMDDILEFYAQTGPRNTQKGQQHAQAAIVVVLGLNTSPYAQFLNPDHTRTTTF